MKAKIQARSLASADLAPNRFAAVQFTDDSAFYPLGDKAVRMECVDTHPTAINSDHFPGVQKPPPLFVAARNIDGAARSLAAHHAAGVRAVSRDDRAAGYSNVGEKTLVALDQSSTDQAGWKLHRVNIIHSKEKSHSPAVCCAGHTPLLGSIKNHTLRQRRNDKTSAQIRRPKCSTR